MKKILILFFIAISLQAQTLIDSYSESNYTVAYGLCSGPRVVVAQSFTGNGLALSQAKFYLVKTGPSPGNCYAQLYAHTGVYGSSSEGSGSALITSSPISASSLSTSPTLITFTFNPTYILTNGTYYCLAVYYNDGDNSNRIYAGVDDSSPTHGGNMTDSDGSTWGDYNNIDAIFYVYGTAPVTYIPQITID